MAQKVLKIIAESKQLLGCFDSRFDKFRPVQVKTVAGENEGHVDCKFRTQSLK